MTKTRALLAATALAVLPSLASAAQITVSITNTQAEDGLYLTPLLTVFHDGTFDTFDVGAPASAGLEALAEEGDASLEVARAEAAGHTAAVITSPGGFAGAPVIDPGETATIRLNLDPSSERFLSFLSMVIPSNDLFIGNANPTAYQIFDAAGAFTGLNTIDVFSGEIWDAGTEANTNSGAAFNPAGGAPTDTTDNVTLEGNASVLIGQNTADGTTVASGTAAGDLLARISIAAVPLPGALSLMAVGLGAGALTTRRRKA